MEAEIWTFLLPVVWVEARNPEADVIATAANFIL